MTTLERAQRPGEVADPYPLQVRLSQGDARALRALAARKGLSLSALGRLLVRNLLDGTAAEQEALTPR